jgi:GTP-binding protein
MKKRQELRNIAIIAHVDHGKTTLVDGLLKQAQVFREHQHVEERVMDSNDLERERGITILSKNTAIQIPDGDSGRTIKINIVDTPGHADFGGEVERVLNMVDGVLLLVDAAEGPKPQTRFVLKKALELGHRAIVVINKVDRKDADPDRVLDETFDLFIELGASDEQADFPVVYAIATQGLAGTTAEVGDDLHPLFETIIREVPPPSVDTDAPFQMLVTTLDYDNYRGLTAIGRIFRGAIAARQDLVRLTQDGDSEPSQAQYIYVYDGLQRREIERAEAGEIIAIAGLESVSIGDTLAAPEAPDLLPTIQVEAPTVRMTFGVSTSPFSGKEGRWGTSRRIRARLLEETRTNVALRVADTDSADQFLVSGRGELHLAILIETMRREGYEFQVSRPEVIMIENEDGDLLEPFEEVHIETSPETVGAVVEMLGKRRGEMQNMLDSSQGTVNLDYIVPTRGLLGFRYQFLTATRGKGVMNTLFHAYLPYSGPIRSKSRGSLVAWEPGKSTTFGLKNAELRGFLFIPPGRQVYEGMVVGEHQRPGDLDINVCKAKHLTNMRKAFRDIDVDLTPARVMSLDEAIEYLSDEDLLEVTPDSLRIRKRILDRHERGRRSKRDREALSS